MLLAKHGFETPPATDGHSFWALFLGSVRHSLNSCLVLKELPFFCVDFLGNVCS